MLAAKVQSALKYKESFPDNDLEYVGFSVNADGDAEPRDMTDKGGSADDNYVTAITEGDSCDLVTTPARGGRGLAVLKESEGGSQEAGMKKKLEAILASLTESFKSVKGDEAKKLAEAVKPLEALINESANDDIFAKKDGETSDAHAARLQGHAKKLAKHLGKYGASEEPAAESGEPAAEAAADPEDPAPKPDADAVESMRDALRGLIRESGLPYTKDMIAELLKKPYREAKAQIAKDAVLAKSIRESAANPVASFHRGGFSESETGNEASFLEAAKGE